MPGTSLRDVRALSTTGTENALFRIGADLVARFPLRPAEEDAVRREADALNAFAARCPVNAPRGVAVGAPSDAYPSWWSVQTWVEGEHPEGTGPEPLLADDLADLIVALRAVDTGGRVFDRRGRGGTLPTHDEWVGECLAQSTGLFDVGHARALWEVLRTLPDPTHDAMSHRDLTPFNLLVSGQSGRHRLAGVLDGGAFGPADPALDLVAAWHLFEAGDRRRLRTRLGSDDREWRRGAAWALQQALGLGWYYAKTNPPMSQLGLRTMGRLLTDPELRRLTA
nr:phosphotransferase [Microbacterium pseudoresistens]